MNYQIQTAAQLSAHLRSLRKARNLTQTQLGKHVRLNQARIGKIERDPAHVSVGQLLQILAALNTRVWLQTSEKGVAADDKPTNNNW
jgi:HTH-type transcriptional regulator / antitoxin HipB